MSACMTEGRCLCGEVAIKVEDLPNSISACHCEPCTRWSGSVQMGIEVPVERVTVTGPVKSHRSSRLAERAWCDTCGSALWLRPVEDPGLGCLELVPGLFENAGGAELARVVYADRAPDGYALAGDHTRVSKAEYEAKYAHLNEDRS